MQLDDGSFKCGLDRKLENDYNGFARNELLDELNEFINELNRYKNMPEVQDDDCIYVIDDAVSAINCAISIVDYVWDIHN